MAYGGTFFVTTLPAPITARLSREFGGLNVGRFLRHIVSLLLPTTVFVGKGEGNRIGKGLNGCRTDFVQD